MDQTGCPEGWARDVAFMLKPQITVDCPVPIALYFTLVGIIVVGKVTLGIVMARTWYIRHDRILKSGDPRRIAAERKRLPIIPTNVVLSSFAYITLYVTIATNTSNIYNGAAYSLYSFGWTMCLALIYIYLPKIVQLANRLAPFALENHGDELKVLSRFQKAMVACARIALVGQAIVLLFFVPIFPGDTDLIRAGLALQATATVSFGLVLTYQIERVIHLVKRMSVRTEEAMDGPAYRAQRVVVKNVLKKLRLQEFMLIIVSFPVAIMSALQVAMILPTHWYIFFINMCADVSLNVGFLSTSARTPVNSGARTLPNGATPERKPSSMRSKSSTRTAPANIPNGVVDVAPSPAEPMSSSAA